MINGEILDDALECDILFQMLPSPSQKAMRSKMVVRDYKTGENVYGFDDTPVGLYFLFNGGLKVEWPGHFDVNASHFYTPGSWFGQLSAMTETKRLVNVIASTNSSVGFINQLNVRKLIDSDPEFQRHLTRVTQARLKTALDIIADLMLRNAEQRLIATLIRLSGISNPFYQPDQYEVCFTQEELARMANITRSTANTTLKRLERAGFLMITYRRVVISRPEELQELMLQEKYGEEGSEKE